MNDELDIQKIAEELIGKLQKQSRIYGEQSDKLKWMAEGARELHDVVRREAQRLQYSGEKDSIESQGAAGDVERRGEIDGD